MTPLEDPIGTDGAAAGESGVHRSTEVETDDKDLRAAEFMIWLLRLFVS